MKRYFTLLVLGIISFKAIAQNVKTIADFSVVYDVIIKDSTTNPRMAKAMSGAKKIVYIKGSKSRSELMTPTFQQAIIYDFKSDSTIVLREVANTKYISFLDGRKRVEANKRFEDIAFTKMNETKNILGYDCKKVLAKLKGGSTYVVFYTPSIIPSNKEFEPQFKDLPGLVLEYEADVENGKWRVTYSASKIDLTPVSSAKFDTPKTGFRVL